MGRKWYETPRPVLNDDTSMLAAPLQAACFKGHRVMTTAAAFASGRRSVCWAPGCGSPLREVA